MVQWFVTGASAGIGREVTQQLLAAGHRVAATARHSGPLQDLAQEYPGLVWIAALDVTDALGVRAVAAKAFAELGRSDVVFSNAGRGAFGAAEELTDQAIAEQVAVNLTGPIELVRAVLPFLRAQGGGRIIQTTTMGAQISSPGGSMYHASKWGVEGFLESIIGEVAPFGIGITMVEPGVVRTGFRSALSIADKNQAYDETPVGRVRQYLGGSGNEPGDPVRVATAIIASATT